MSRSIERLTLQERADWSAYESTSITFDQMRFGQPPDEVTEARSESLARTSDLFRQQVWLLADTLDADIDEVATTLDVVTAHQDHVISGRELAAGTVAGQRWRWSGRRDGRTLVEIEALWTVGGEDPPDWPTPQHGWTLTVEGEPSMQVHFISLASFERRASMAEHVAAANIATAMQAVNAIPAVCAAPPGFATAATLPVIRSARGFGGQKLNQPGHGPGWHHMSGAAGNRTPVLERRSRSSPGAVCIDVFSVPALAQTRRRQTQSGLSPDHSSRREVSSKSPR